MRTAIKHTPVMLGLALVLALAGTAAARPLEVIVEVVDSKGLRRGDIVREGAAGAEIGHVTDVGFGTKDSVEIEIEIDEAHAEKVRKSSAFLVPDARTDERPQVEHYASGPGSPPAKPGTRFQGQKSLAEVWLKRGRIEAQELSAAIAAGSEALRRNIEELQRSKEWSRFRDQIARLSAEMTISGMRMADLLSSQVPKLEAEMDRLYRQYLDELERARPTPEP